MSKSCEIRTKDGIEKMIISKTRAVRFRCLDCCGYSPGQVKDCDSINCFLYDMRMTGKLTGEKSATRRNKAIRDYCNHCMGGNRHEIKNCPDNNCSLWAFRSTKG